MNIEKNKKLYTPGTKIKCLKMEDDYPVEPGTIGEVEFVDDMGTIHVNWNDGRNLGLVVGVDSFEIVQEIKKDYIKRNVDFEIDSPLLRKELITPLRHKVEIAIEVSDKEYQDLLSDPFKSRDYIEDHLDEMYTNEDGLLHSILVYSPSNNDGILIESEGFNYPRYQSYINNVHDLLELNSIIKDGESIRYDKLKVLIVEPNIKPYTAIIENDLEVLQSLVGGYIETVYLSENAEIICNEEGKMLDLPANRRLGNDVIAGRFLIVGNDGSEHFTSLSDKDINNYLEEFSKLEVIDQREIQDKLHHTIVF